MNNLKTCVLAVLLVNGDLFKDREHLLWSDPFNEELLKFSRNSDGSRRARESRSAKRHVFSKP